MNARRILVTFGLIPTLLFAAEEHSVSVTGTCRKELTPDRSALVLTAEFRDKDAQVTAHKATEIFERVRKEILENFQTRPRNLRIFSERSSRVGKR